MCKTVLASCNHEILGLHKAKVLAQYRTVQYACTHTTHHQISHRPELQQAWLRKSLAPSIKNLTIRLGSFGWFCRCVTMALLLDTVPVLVLSPDPANKKVMSASYNRISKTSRTPPPSQRQGAALCWPLCLWNWLVMRSGKFSSIKPYPTR